MKTFVRVLAPGIWLAWQLVVLAAQPHSALAQTAPFGQSPVIGSVSFDFSTHVRRAPGSDNWPLTWADDDHQYTSWGDGGGFSGTDSNCRVGLGFARIEGPASGFTGHDIWGDPACADFPAQFGGKTRTVLSIGSNLYFWGSPGSDISGLDYQRLYKSTNHGASWTNTGVEWTYATHQIGLFAFLQFGKAYQGARDGYVYLYAANLLSYTWATQKPGQLFLLRVPISGLESQAQYQFFRGLDGSGNPLWGSFAERRPAFEDPNGVMRSSAIYNPGLGRYLLVTNHTQNSSGNIGIFDAPEPWGPWTTAAYLAGWPQGGEVEKNAFFANFSPKWWSNGGRDFVFVFTGKNANDSFNSVQGSFVPQVPDTGNGAPGLAAHWRLDEGAETIALDSSGGGNTASLLNGPTWSTGPMGGALTLDGVDDVVVVNDPGTGSALDLTAAFTIGAWVRFAALPTSGAASNPRILQKSVNISNAGSYYFVARTTTVPPVLSLRLKFGGVTYTLDGATALATDRWYHASAVKEGSSVRLYLDGFQDGPAFTVPPGAPDANNDPLYIGEATSNSDGALSGSIDDVRLYDLALSAPELLQLVTPPGSPTNLAATSADTSQVDLAWVPPPAGESSAESYRIDRDGVPVGTTTTNSFSDTGLETATTYVYVVVALNGVGLAGEPSQSVAVTTPTSGVQPPSGGRFASYLGFDGNTDYALVIDPGTGSALDLGADFTIGAWVRFASLPASGAASNPRILQKSVNISNTGSYYFVARTTTVPPVLSLRLKFGGVTSTLDGATALATNRWYHAAAVKEGSSVRLYLDGVQDGPAFAVPPDAPDANDDPLYIGEAPSNSDGALSGSIDDVRLYDRALSAGEIASTKDLELTGAEPGLVLCLPLNEGTGQSFGSITPAGLAGWRGATVSAETTDPAWASDLNPTAVETDTDGSADPSPPVAEPMSLELHPLAARGGPAVLTIRSPRPVTGSLDLFDVRGRLVKTLLPRGPIQAGTTTLVWRGTTEQGPAAASGVYFARLRADGETLVRRIVRIK